MDHIFWVSVRETSFQQDFHTVFNRLKSNLLTNKLLTQIFVIVDLDEPCPVVCTSAGLLCVSLLSADEGIKSAPMLLWFVVLDSLVLKSDIRTHNVHIKLKAT